MALRFIEGFDDGQLGAKGWSSFGGNYFAFNDTGRFGGTAIRTDSIHNAMYAFGSPLSGTIFLGIAIKPASNVSQTIIFSFGIARIRMEAGGRLSLIQSNNNALIATSASEVWQGPGIWRYIELKMNTATGQAEVRSDEVTVVNGVLPVSASVSSIIIHEQGNSSTVDDIYILDDTGSVNNTFLGDVRVQTLLPMADGTHADMTPSTGSSHFALVDEPAPNTTDFVSSSIVGAMDTYQFQGLSPNTASVYGLEVANYSHKDATGPAGLANVVRVGSTDYVSGSVQLSASWAVSRNLMEQNPATGSVWAPSDVNSAEFGVKVT
jgi:hypothetical protein